MTRGCSVQTYWYDNGVQRAAYCSRAARHLVRALDGSITHMCSDHRDNAIEAGAIEVQDYER